MTASKLVRPDVEYKESYLAALREFHAEGRRLYNDLNILEDDFANFVNALKADRGQPHQPYQEWVDQVPETIAWLVKDGEYIGTVEIRHRLNWHLERWGGHIHFLIRPSMRGKGYGKKILLKAMPIANYLGIEKALLTVEPDNQAAIKIIQYCGGVLEDESPATEQFPARLRYWLDCT